ncbi:M20/M25/M40 family metallo-hydrolase [Blastopirellula marina]|uniref:Peptidase M20 n=1 Tax=Blastopirellula marina TaxID=124 RepID=A0A2S8FHJ7_9BACT|nr:M20/M25/M40 family metallo-hydrolase [Blastopirellula marina]PQO31613.1 peptidase M20 [Blastopirellula marina]PTL42920.1 peptidase M20 [Blastopirellula marina]
MLTTTQQERALELVQSLMAIPGKSGEEAEVAAFVRAQLLEAGVPESAMQHDSAHTRCPVPSSTTGNLIVHLPGNQDRPRRLLMAHMDTVPICVGSRPTRDADFLVPQDKHTGLGADDRAGVATVLFAATELLRQDLPHGPLTLLFTVQEEIGLQGARNLEIDKLGEPALAFNWDGSDPVKLTVGAIGGYRMAIDIYGKASHAGVAPQKGVSAVTVAGLAIAKLHQAGLLGKIDQGDLQGTSNIGVIHGGNATNVVADHVRLLAEVRSHQKDSIEVLVQRFEKAFQEAAQEVTNVEGEHAAVEFDGDLNYEPFTMPTDSANVVIAERVLKSLDVQPVHAIANGGLDANWMFRHGIPTVSLGCGQQNPHMTSERLSIPQFHTACEIALRIACGEDGAS